MLTEGVRRGEVLGMTMSALPEGAAAGVFEVTSPPDTARALLGMIQAITVWFIPGRGRLTASELAARYLDIAGHTVGLRYQSARPGADGAIDRARQSDG